MTDHKTNLEQMRQIFEYHGFEFGYFILDPFKQGQCVPRERNYFWGCYPEFLSEFIGRTVTRGEVKQMIIDMTELVDSFHNTDNINFNLHMDVFLYDEYTVEVQDQRQHYDDKMQKKLSTTAKAPPSKKARAAKAKVVQNSKAIAWHKLHKETFAEFGFTDWKVPEVDHPPAPFIGDNIVLSFCTRMRDIVYLIHLIKDRLPNHRNAPIIIDP